MNRFIILALFLNVAMAQVPFVCDFVCTPEILDSCPVRDCGPNESLQHKPGTCDCCNVCLPNKGSDCKVDCSTDQCPQIKCATGYESYTPPCECCNKCRKIKNTCGKNEVYTECGSACPKTCANLGKDQVCTEQCVKGCFCQKGLVRNDYGECVQPSQCPKPPSCGKHEVYDYCGSACPRTCANLGKDQVCTAQCVAGCFCQKGLVRNNYGQCVHPNQCPKPTPGSEVCETVDCRGSPCPVVDCAPGYKPVRSWCGCCDKCEPVKTLPGSEVCAAIDCNGNECKLINCIEGSAPVRSDCGCCDTCEPIKKPDDCQTDCSGSYNCPTIPENCPDGFEMRIPKCRCCPECLKKDDCQTDCSGTFSCPATPENCPDGYELGKPICGCCPECLKKESDLCELDCSGAYSCPATPANCSEGYELGIPICRCCPICLKEDTCGKNEVYTECGSACPVTCANLGKDQVCSAQCITGCFCQKGLIRNDNGECVHPNQCPKPISNTCGKHEVYTECGSACPKTCANLGKDEICTLQCVEGCFCEEGLVRNDYGECVHPSQCPKPPPPTCGKNEIYTECGSACPQTCANLGKDQVCTAQCVIGCFCEEGLVRNDYGECVHPTQCPKPPPPTCGKNEVYSECGSACPQTCANLGNNQVCTSQCVKGCFCREGLIRNDEGVCVQPNQCPKPLSETCGKNEVYNDCGSACPQTCANLGNNQVCTAQCVKGCFCREGLIRNDQGDCVDPNQCPKRNPGSEVCGTIDCKGRPCQKIFCADNYKLVKTECGCCDKCEPLKTPSCGKHEVYDYCGSACPKTCANLGKGQVCSFQCVKGCFCEEGLVRNDNGECVQPKKCPKPPSKTCGKHEVYTKCGSACPKTCANLGKDQVCTAQCVEGCFCRKGLVRNEKGKCVHPNKCPKRSCKNADEDSDSKWLD